MIEYTKRFSSTIPIATLTEDQFKKLYKKNSVSTTDLAYQLGTAYPKYYFNSAVLSNTPTRGTRHQQLKDHHYKKTGIPIDYQHIKDDNRAATYKDSSGNTIIRHNTILGADSTLAHELGHVENQKRKFHKLEMKAYQAGKVATDFPGAILNITAASNSGYRNELNKFQGKKEKLRHKIIPWIIPVMSLGTLPEELRASRNGMGYLRAVGASKKELKDAKIDLYLAGSTYLVNSLTTILDSLAHKKIGQTKAKQDIIKILAKNYPDLTKTELEELYKRTITHHKNLMKSK